MPDDHDTCIRAYRRILRNAEKGKGVRLTASEVDAMANYDSAIRNAVEREDIRSEGDRDGD